MSSSDLTSDKSVDSKAIDDKEDLDALADSIDASLDAILSEAKESTPSNGEVEAAAPATETAPSLIEVPPAEVHVALPQNSASEAQSLGDDQETPFPVIVEDDEPSYKAFADMVAPPDESRAAPFSPPELEPAPEAMPAAVVEAASEESESAEILDADELIDSMTPAPVLLDEIAAAPEGARTEESAAFVAPAEPPSDEEILDHVKLPPGSTPMPMPLVASLAQEPVDTAPGSSLLDDDKTVISPMPVMPEPSVALPPPRRITSAWAPVEPSIQLQPDGLGTSLQPDGLGTKLGRAVKSPVQTSVATLAVVVLLASAAGGGVVRLLSGSPRSTPPVATAPAKVETPAPAVTPLPAAAVAEKELEKVVPKAAVAEKEPEKPAPKAAARPAAKPAAQQTHIALAAPAAKPAPAKKPAPAPAKAKKASGTAWVDPFGQ